MIRLFAISEKPTHFVPGTKLETSAKANKISFVKLTVSRASHEYSWWFLVGGFRSLLSGCGPGGGYEKSECTDDSLRWLFSCSRFCFFCCWYFSFLCSENVEIFFVSVMVALAWFIRDAFFARFVQRIKLFYKLS